MYVVAGVAERDGEAIYNSACLIGPEGLVAVYRKTHLTESERAWASPGDAWVRGRHAGRAHRSFDRP